MDQAVAVERPAEVTTVQGGWLSRYARGRKLEYFFRDIPKSALILDFGCADGWVERWAKQRGFVNIVGLDLRPPADIVGDIHDWQNLGLSAHSFDVIVAFEVVEHGDFAGVLWDLLKPGGKLIATTPVPRLDWMCKTLEALGVLQRRTGPHTNLTDLRDYPGFEVIERKTKGLMSQWGIMTPARQRLSRDSG